jgi:hypothetical protein
MFTVPKEKTKYINEISNFLGVDFTSSPLEVDLRRSPNAKNVINNDGYNETRHGYEILKTFTEERINGVWNIDTNIGDLFLVHAGTKLYQCTSDFSETTQVLSGMEDDLSTGLYFNEYLIIFDGVRPVVFSCFDGTNYEAKFLDTCGYIPTTSVSRDANGGGTDYEPYNMISPYATNTFLAQKIEGPLDGQGNPTYVDQSTFKLDMKGVTAITSVEKLKANGDWETVSSYTYSLADGEVYFTPGESPITGRDNVKITYQYNNSNSKSKINKCRIAALYGYEGNGNRIFATGNEDFPNYDYWCEQENCLYWPDENFAKIGIQPIVGYAKLNDGSLAILKKHSDTDNTIYYRTYNLLNTTEVFPLKDGVKNIGCVSSYATTNLLNDPLMLTTQGVFAIIGDNGEKYAMQRSYYVNGKLLKEQNLENAYAIAVDGKYYLAINGHMYIADSRYLSYPKHGKTEQYQYEWWYWDNIPARMLFQWENKLYFGTADGEICGFTEEYYDGTDEVEAYWETPFMNFGQNQKAKSIKNVTLMLNTNQQSQVTFGYYLDDGDQVEIATELTSEDAIFPRTIHEKEKIKKFMFVKFFFQNATEYRMSFERLSIEYVIAGRYKGE